MPAARAARPGALRGYYPDGGMRPDAWIPPSDLENDWFYGRYTPICNASLTYEASIEPTHAYARLFMTFFWTTCLWIIYSMPQQPLRPSYSGIVPEGKPPRWKMLDAVRIMAVVGVIIEHSGGTTYSEHNTAFSTNLVLPWLFIVSGISFMLSRSSALHYFRRLSGLFVTGVLCNVFGDALARPHWYNDLGNTIYQMWFVVFIMSFALVSWPLRAVLRDSDRHVFLDASAAPTASMRAIALGYGTLCSLAVVVYLSGWRPTPPPDEDDRWLAHIAPILANGPWIFAHVSGFPALAALHASLGRVRDGRLTWLLLAYVYIPRVLFPMSFALAPQMVFLFFIGVVVQAQPLLGSEAIVRCVRAYWPFVAVCLLLTTMPDLLGRCDLFPPLTVWERLRWDSVELTLAVLLITKTLEASDPFEIFDALGYWALFAFCTHVMLVRIFVALTPSLAAAVEFALAPLFVVCFRYFRRPTPSKDGYGSPCAAAPPGAATGDAKPLFPAAEEQAQAGRDHTQGARPAEEEPLYGTFDEQGPRR